MKKIQIDFPLLIFVLILVSFGLLSIFNASSYIAYRDFGDKYRYIRDQFQWVALGLTAMTVATFFDYRKLYNLSLPILISAIVLLVGVFIPGIGIYALGANRWIDARFFIIQPAEYVKLGLAIYLAAWFSRKENGRFLAFCLLIGLVLGLVMLEPDMGTASVILVEAAVIYFLSGGSIWKFLAAVPVVGVAGFLLIKFSPYRAARLATFMNIGDSPEHATYHVRQILIALGSGGITGLGLGNSLQKYAYLPENTTDSIFAIIAEEVGFIGSTILVLIFMAVVWRGFVIAVNAKDTFGKLLAGGIISFLAVQAFINLAAQTALIPLTGIPLPFISYGGSALVIDMCAIGILLSISRQSRSKIESTIRKF